MSDKVISFIILVFLIIVCNVHDFANLYQGSNRYIQRPSGMLGTTLFLMAIPMVVFGLKGTVMLWVIIILEVIYITIYTLIYFKIKEERDNKR